MRWITGLGIAAVGIFSAIAIKKSADRSKRGGLGLGRSSIDPYESTGKPQTPVFYKKPKKDEPGGCLLIGRKHDNIEGSNEYRVCLTENQRETLFGDKIGRKLGCGVFACAYASRTRVIKFTRDQDDVAALIEAQPTGVVPKLYNVFKLKQGGEMPAAKPWLSPTTVSVYAISLERLKPLSVPRRKILDEVIWQTPDVVAGHLDQAEVCASAGPEAPICKQTINVARKLKAAGIDWKDVHGGNIGIDRKGRVKALDLGLSSTELKRRIDVLEGRQLARPLRKKLLDV